MRAVLLAVLAVFFAGAAQTAPTVNFNLGGTPPASAAPAQ